MQNYHDLMQDVLDIGEDQLNQRTGEICRVLVGRQLTYHDVQKYFPAITTKPLAFKGCRGELLGFFRGYTNAADFRALDCQVWNQNANETQAWLANPYRNGHDDLGVIYGKQWTAWKDRRIAGNEVERDRLEKNGYKLRMASLDGTEWLMEREINQLENALRTLLTNPSDRRIIVSGWNVAELDMMALPPCHMDYRFTALQNQEDISKPHTLHVTMTIRSWDLYLGGPFNIASTSMFLCIMARLAGMIPGSVTIQATNAHIYHAHIEKVREQMAYDHLPAPSLILSENIRKVSLDEIPGVFARIKPEDITIPDYAYHKWDSKAPMAA